MNPGADVHREFLVEMRTVVPPGTSIDVEDDKRRGEARRIAELADEGSVLRLWRTVDATGEFTIGLWRAIDEAALRALLGSLPLFPWMDVAIRPLTRHPNDPKKRADA